jgi:serine/threonine protein kinase
MKALHHVATGLKQLHNVSVAHQDLKPSNVLVYAASEGSKICDLGRAWDKHKSAAHDGWDVAGDRRYAPPEFLYFAVPADENARRFGCDLYQLGSLVVFCFSRVHMNALLAIHVHPDHRPGIWGGTYQGVLPALSAAFDLALAQFERDVPDFLKAEMRQTVAELCEPDPTRRGHPMNHYQNQFSLERYVSRFDRLAHVARLQLVRSAI